MLCSTGNKARHFENSLLHKVRQRIHQSYLVLCPLLQVGQAALLFDALCLGLLEHNQQTSVRYLAEWCVAVICIGHPHLAEQVWSWMDRAGR